MATTQQTNVAGTDEVRSRGNAQRRAGSAAGNRASGRAAPALADEDVSPTPRLHPASPPASEIEADRSRLITLDEASEYLNGKSRYALWTWCRRGLRPKGAPPDARIKLQHRLLGHSMRTTKAWLDKFIADYTAASQEFHDQKAAIARGEEPAPTARHLRAAEALKDVGR
jgi:hypothetical protein